MNLTLQLPVTFIEAALGADIQVPTYPAGSVTLRLPAGTQTGSTFRVKGEGVKDLLTSGDLLVTVEITVPQTLDKQQEKALQELKDLFPETSND